MKLILVGPPGSGKSTQGEKIVRDFGFEIVSTGEVFREYFKDHDNFQGVYSKNDLESGVLCEDNVMSRFVAEEILTPVGEKLIIDGYPRTIAQARAFDLMMRKRNEDYAIINFELKDDNIAMERILGRRDGRNDDFEKVARNRLETYRREATRLIPLLIMNTVLFLNVDASQTPENMYNQIKPYLEVLLEK